MAQSIATYETAERECAGYIASVETCLHQTRRPEDEGGGGLSQTHTWCHVSCMTDHGSWCMDHELCIVDHGPCIMGHGPWMTDHGQLMMGRRLCIMEYVCYPGVSEAPHIHDVLITCPGTSVEPLRTTPTPIITRVKCDERGRCPGFCFEKQSSPMCGRIGLAGRFHCFFAQPSKWYPRR